MKTFVRIAAATAIAAVAIAVPATAASAHSASGTSGSEVPCEEWYITDNGGSQWNNCDPDGRRQLIEVTDTVGGVSPLCMKPGINILAHDEVGTGYIMNVQWNNKYCG